MNIARHALCGALVLAPALTQAETQEEKIAPADAPLWEYWQGDVEFGFEATNGNNHTRDLHAELDLTREGEQWRQKFGALAKFGSEDGVRDEEEYRLSLRGDRKLGEGRFLYGEVEFVSDIFSGFKYRVNETVGYGQTIFQTESMKLDVLGGIGLQTFEEDDFDTEHEAVFKPGADFSWDVNENVVFTQDFRSTIGSELVASHATSAVKTKMSENLSLRVSLRFDHLSEVPADKKKLDTTTMLGLVYQF